MTLERTEVRSSQRRNSFGTLFSKSCSDMGFPIGTRSGMKSEVFGTVPACWDVVRLGDVTDSQPQTPST